MNISLAVQRLHKELKIIAGEENVLTSREEIMCYSFDSTNTVNINELADVIVFPLNTEMVSKILKYAFEHKIAVTPRSAGTNLVGACCPKKRGILLDFSRMNKIKEINKQNLYCIAEPGVIIKELQNEVEKIGLFYPPDPSNHIVSMLGGSIGLSSGGPHTFKYGSTKDYIIDLEVVLSNGEVIHTGSKCAKNVTGYNLTQLFIGSEGTLGIITEATIKLIPKPEDKKVMLVYFNSFEDTCNSVNDIISSLITPSVIDLLDKNTLKTVEAFYPSGLKTDSEAALLIEIDGFKSELPEQYLKIMDICNKNNASYIQSAKTEEEAQKIWTSRRSSFGATAKLAPDVVTEDIVVPRENIVNLVNGINEICAKYSLKLCLMGHIGDGNIHPNIALDLRNPEEFNNFEKAKEEIFKLALSLNGTLSGEHGIGCEKSMYMKDAVGTLSFEYMKKIKNIFDSKNILNPNKIF